MKNTGIKNTGLLRAAVHYALSAVILGVYGGQVCPYIEGLGVGYWLVVLGAFFAMALIVRQVIIIKTLPGEAHPGMAGRHFFIELGIVLVTSLAITAFNMLRHDFPFGSGMKIVVGAVSLGFFASADLALMRERLVYEHFARSGLSIVPGKKCMPVTSKFLIISIASVTMITSVIFLVISKDLEWLSALVNEDMDKARMAVFGELAFISAVVLAGTFNLIVSYARNLRIFIDNENSSLKAVAGGDFQRPVIVSTNDEFGEMAHYTNRMIEQLRLKIDEIKNTQDAAIVSLASLAEIRDMETGMHIVRTKLYVKVLAEHLSDHPDYRELLTPETIELMHKSAPLHDIGKVGVPDAILLKPGRLTPEEFEVMKMHPVYGGDALGEAEQALGGSSFLSLAREIAYSHHEKWDGSGYPRGLKGRDIPVSGRLMALSDVYDALMFKRVYKPALPHEETREIILKDRGRHFDPDVVDAFIETEDAFISIVREHGG